MITVKSNNDYRLIVNNQEHAIEPGEQVFDIE